MNGSIIYLAALLAGLGFQFFLRWSATKNLWLSFFILAVFPYLIGFGSVCGIWIGCAFIPYSSGIKRLPSNYRAGWKEVIVFSLWTFCGFLLTLVYLLKIKLTGHMRVDQSEALAWVFFLMIEICIFRIISCTVPGWFRIPLGYRMGFLNYLLVLYWTYSYGWFANILTLLTLLVVFPLLLKWMKFSNGEADMVVTGGNK